MKHKISALRNSARLRRLNPDPVARTENVLPRAPQAGRKCGSRATHWRAAKRSLCQQLARQAVLVQATVGLPETTERPVRPSNLNPFTSQVDLRLRSPSEFCDKTTFNSSSVTNKVSVETQTFREVSRLDSY